MGIYNIKENYVDKDNPRSYILAESALYIISTENGLKSYSKDQLEFGRDMILRIKHTADWKLIHHKNQTQINKDNIR